MKLICLGSSSDGNCYLLTDSQNQTLIIEAGIKPEQISAAIGAADIAGAIISHRHGDHAKQAAAMLKRGWNVYALPDVAEYYKIANKPFFATLEPAKAVQIGDYTIIAFSVEHDVPCVGFYINHYEVGNIVFLTDLHQSEYVFPDVNYFMVEANYEEKLLAANKNLPSSVKQRIRETHAEISVTEELLKANDLSAVKQIFLIHLSDQNSNAEAFCRRIHEATLKQTYVLDSGVEIILH